jgi:hypothetical protein
MVTAAAVGHRKDTDIVAEAAELNGKAAPAELNIVLMGTDHKNSHTIISPFLWNLIS